MASGGEERSEICAQQSGSAQLRGSEAHDEIYRDERGFYRETNHAGGARGRHVERRGDRHSGADEAAADTE